MVAVNEKVSVVFEDAVKFDDLLRHQTNGGCHIHADGLTVTAPTIMWVEVVNLHASGSLFFLYRSDVFLL